MYTISLRCIVYNNIPSHHLPQRAPASLCSTASRGSDDANPAIIQCMTVDEIRSIALSLPGVAEGVSYGMRSFNVQGKYLGRIAEDGATMSIYIDRDQREAWQALDPKTFTVPKEYQNYTYMAVNVRTVRQEDMHTLLENAWRSRAPASLRARKPLSK